MADDDTRLRNALATALADPLSAARGRSILEASGDPRFAPVPGFNVQPPETPGFNLRLANALAKAPEAIWGSLPPTARSGYKSLANALAEMSPGAAIRDAVDASGNTMNALARGDIWGSLGGGASLLTAMAGAVPGGRGAGKGMQELYHVAGPEWRAGDALRSLYSRLGDAAYDVFAKRWPEAGNLGQDHAHKVFFYDKLSDATSHADDFGGTVLRVDPQKVPGLYLDTLERGWDRPGFYATRDDVPWAALTTLSR